MDERATAAAAASMAGDPENDDDADAECKGTEADDVMGSTMNVSQSFSFARSAQVSPFGSAVRKRPLCACLRVMLVKAGKELL